MRAMEGCVWRDRERWRLRHITFPQCIKGTSLSVTHTVRMGGEGGWGWRGRERARERRAEGGGDRDEEDEEKRAGKEGSGLFLSYL